MSKGAPAAFLLAQLGAQAARRFAEALAPLDLAPPHAGILRMLALSSGLSQRDLAGRLGMHPSRLVAILDEMESRGLVVRQPHAEDRRVYSLQLTPKGQETWAEVGRIGREHNEKLLAPLTAEESAQLASLLKRIADAQGLTPGVHPGFSTLGERKPKC